MVLGDGVRGDATGGPRAVVPLMVLGDGVRGNATGGPRAVYFIFI